MHLPFCVHRCGYCDFVTAVGKRDEHGPYVDALLAELALEAHVLAPRLDTIFVGGGTPTFTEPASLARLLEALPPAAEVSVEANPETLTAELAALLRDGGVDRVSLGAQSFQPRLLEVLERRATPEDVRRSVALLRQAGFDNISLDLLYGIPGQTRADLDADLAEALALGPEHLSCYELESLPGTRFAHAHGARLAEQAEAMETYFEQVVERLVGAGYRWYETANFCLDGPPAGGRDLRSHHNLGYWQAHDYLGLGVGAVSTLPPGDAAGAVVSDRRRNLPSVPRYVAALRGGAPPPREVEPLDAPTKAAERLMLGLRLDEPLALADVEPALDRGALARMTDRGLVEAGPDGGTLALTRRGRFLGGAVTAELLAV